MTSYIGAVKSRAGEYVALSLLDHVTRSRFVPMVELLPRPAPRSKASRGSKPPPTIDEQVAHHVKLIAQASSTTHRVLVDFTYLPMTRMSDGGNSASMVMSGLHSRSVQAAPVISGSSPLPLVKALAGPWCTENGVALRLTPVDLDSGFDTIEVLLSFLGVGTRDVDLIADFGSIDDATSVRLGSVNAALTIMATKPWRSMSFAAASLPMPLAHTGEAVFPRLEWEVWKQIDEERVGCEVGFADWGIRNIQPPVDGGSRPIPNQRYTFDSDWLVLRGKSQDSYLWRELAIELVNDRRFQNASHCAGCRQWKAFADGQPGATGATSQLAIQYGMIHHITVVGQQLASLAARTAAS